MQQPGLSLPSGACSLVDVAASSPCRRDRRLRRSKGRRLVSGAMGDAESEDEERGGDDLALVCVLLMFAGMVAQFIYAPEASA